MSCKRYKTLLDERKKIEAQVAVNGLDDLTQMFGFPQKEEATVVSVQGRYRLQLGVASKVFELAPVGNLSPEHACVVLVYLNARYAPTVWVYSARPEPRFDFLADHFTTFLRMAVTHLGLPCWPLLFTNQDVPNWTYKLMRIVAPGLLRSRSRHSKATAQGTATSTCLSTPEQREHHVVNRLDTNVFKVSPKSTAAYTTRADKPSSKGGSVGGGGANNVSVTTLSPGNHQLQADRRAQGLRTRIHSRVRSLRRATTANTVAPKT